MAMLLCGVSVGCAQSIPTAQSWAGMAAIGSSLVESWLPLTLLYAAIAAQISVLSELKGRRNVAVW